MQEKTIQIINNIEQIEVLANEMEFLGVEWNIPLDTVMSMNLVLEELISNIIFYGYQDKKTHQITVHFSLEQKKIKICIEDDGIEFNPLLAAEPDTNAPIEERKIGGLGIHFARKLTDHISYERKENKNLLTLTKILS